MSTVEVPRTATVGDQVKRCLESASTSSLDPEEVIEKLNSMKVEWWITDAGDLFIKYWQLGAEDFMPPEHVARVRSEKMPPPDADKLEWVSSQLGTLREEYG